jgi:hypothetical protein
LPKEKSLPSPGDFWLEVETAKKHGGWAAWRGLATVEKARLLAHELHKGMREHYEYDQRAPAKTEAEKSVGGSSPLSAMREKFLGGGFNKNA